MTFSLQIKQELLDNKPMRLRYKKAMAYGLFLLGRSFTPDEVSLRTENEETVRLFQWFTAGILGNGTEVATGQNRRGDKTVYTAAISRAEDRIRLLNHFGQVNALNRDNLPTREDAGAFLAGAYLSCGNSTDPAKSYHLEFVARNEAAGKGLAQLLEESVPGARISTRRKARIIYYKECGQIEDLLTRMGATKASLALIDIELYKSIRNRANRATNCETANIDKLVGASASQVEDIELILAVKGEAFLPEPLRLAAQLRLENPDISLRELADLSPVKITRSGMHHRLDKLSKIAGELRGR